MKEQHGQADPPTRTRWTAAGSRAVRAAQRAAASAVTHGTSPFFRPGEPRRCLASIPTLFCVKSARMPLFPAPRSCGRLAASSISPLPSLPQAEVRARWCLQAGADPAYSHPPSPHPKPRRARVLTFFACRQLPLAGPGDKIAAAVGRLEHAARGKSETERGWHRHR